MRRAGVSGDTPGTPGLAAARPRAALRVLGGGVGGGSSSGSSSKQQQQQHGGHRDEGVATGHRLVAFFLIGRETLAGCDHLTLHLKSNSKVFSHA